MCTIGCLYTDGAVYTFKQCDLTQQTLFYDPEVVQGTAGRYMAFRRKGRPGIWAGVNQKGVSFVAADYYTNSDPGTPNVPEPVRFLATNTHLDANDDIDRLFLAYEASIANQATARSAINYLSNWYLKEGNPSDPQHPNFKYPDIALLADGKEGIFLEYYPGDDQKTPQVKTLTAQAGGWFASTNHARMFAQTVDYPKNHSTYLRLARAEAILNLGPTPSGIKSVLRDQYYGQTELSICRVANAPGEYYTQATVILGAAAAGSVWTEYLINGNPRTKPYTVKNLSTAGSDARPDDVAGEALPV